MKDDLRALLIMCGISNNIDMQQALKEIIIQLKIIAYESGLDFDLALDKSEPEINFPPSECQHVDAFPYGGDHVYCPNCKQNLIQGKTVLGNYLKENHWR